ncbi:PH domain-containing protein [Aeromicrobium sp. 636]|uniref:PH domain-containing protein n=1 Tax=Aeromicrobium senzhongii TaxID=2663859 RepID=A0A8I0ET55_9ACTN|nr:MULTISPECIES: PH domain-containing protein [Aeromicrobium]MBC9225153.1 PH domain-containing protein [Aeromicrobium senzhongii]MCQ3997263.1 PH domain-containing protein [Aeromicrobium sp. 636]MTB87195.1 PH domain-containing protein [Aeromicrobium senzhongii]QNL95728.1 PH domain-containing protein [Aeromicrobium senzhongii]
MRQDLFTSTEGQWTPVSSRLATVRGLIGTITGVVLVLVSLGLWLVFADAAGAWEPVLWVPAVIGVGLTAWVWWWAPRNRRSWGYAEAEDDFLVRGGIMFRRLVVVPYGRMQFVDVESGPLARWFGFGTVTLHTASTATAAAIPGVPLDEAARLRDRLTDLGESHGAGV